MLEFVQSTPLIFTDFPKGSGFQLCEVLEICKYQRHPQVYWKNSNVVGNCLMQTIIKSYYFWNKCIDYLLCSKIHFLIDHHCKTQSESFDTLEKCQDCLMFFQGVLALIHMLLLVILVSSRIPVIVSI